MKIVCILCAFCIFSCNTSRKENLTRGIEKSLGELNIKKYRTYLIIPFSGCTGCINEAEQFMLSNLNRRDICYILTSFRFRKDLRLKLGHQIFHSSSVKFDSAFTFNEPV
jgi:hypothetical protein